MFRAFYPTAYYKNIYDIPLNMLKKNNIKGLVFDIDNTLAPYYCPEPDDDTVAFMERAVSEGFSVCLLSNNSSKRVLLYNERLRLPVIPRACKPLRRGLRKAMSIMGTTKENTVIIGDQIFTDVLCGNRLGVRSILVEPCSEKDEWITKIKRGLEKKVVAEYIESKKKRESL